MAPETFIGRKMRDLIPMHNANHYGFRVYRLQGPEDTAGIFIAEDYTIESLLDRVPSLTYAKIISAYDYYGTFILRVRSRR